MSFTQNDCGQCDIINIIITLTNELQIRYMPSFQTNIRSIPQPQYLNMWMLWLQKINRLLWVYLI